MARYVYFGANRRSIRTNDSMLEDYDNQLTGNPERAFTSLEGEDEVREVSLSNTPESNENGMLNKLWARTLDKRVHVIYDI